MANLLEVLTRSVVGNRRRERRQRRRYDVVIRNEHGHRVFSGHSLDISKGGAKLVGVPCHMGLTKSQRVTIEILLIPRSRTMAASWGHVPAHVVRLVDKDEGLVAGVKFDRPLSHL